MSHHDQADRVALVTGASHGIGLEVVRQLAERGATVYLTARSEQKAEEAVAQLGGGHGSVSPLALDVNNEDSVRHAAAEVEREHGRLDILVNNAAQFADWQEMPSSADLDAARQVVETNLFGLWRVTQAFLPLLRASKSGRIVNVTSGAGSHGDEKFGLTANGGSAASYGVSKAAANALTSKLASEFDGSDLLINAVDPGLTATTPGMEEMGARPITDGAASVVWAATLGNDGPSGGFFRDGNRHPW